MPRDRMFHVLVLGGMALVAPAACGDRTALPGEAAAEAVDASLDAADERTVFPDGSTEEFPSEGIFFDGSLVVPDSGDASGHADAFPSELPVIPDAGQPDRDAGFPIEK